MNGRFILKASGDQFSFDLKAGNNKVILTSERYAAKAGALQAIAAVRENSAHDGRYERRLSSSAEPYFVLKAAGNHEVLGTSALYSSVGAREDGIGAVKANAASATIEDLTRA